MSRAVLLVDHGSRREEANAQLDALVVLVRNRLPACLIVGAHLELVPPTVAEGIEQCVQSGATEIVIHPFFLAPGRHSSEDLPQLARDGSARHPGVSIRVGPPLGLHGKLIDAVLARIDQAFSGTEDGSSA